MKLLDSFTIRTYSGKTYALPNGEAAKRFSGMLELNELGALIFKCLKRPTTERKISYAIMDSYVADQATVFADVKNFVEKLRAAKLIID